MTYETIYRKWGKSLATTDKPILNPLQISDCFFIPQNDEWRNEGISLEKYKSSKNAVIRFNYISGLGGSINIDNIQFGSNLDAPKMTSSSLHVYPNPANDYLQIDFGNEPIYHVRVHNSMGQIILQNSLDKPMENYVVNTRNLESGIYTISVIKKDGNRYSKKVIVQH
jgi:hypothetical protein